LIEQTGFTFCLTQISQSFNLPRISIDASTIISSPSTCTSIVNHIHHSSCYDLKSTIQNGRHQTKHCQIQIEANCTFKRLYQIAITQAERIQEETPQVHVQIITRRPRQATQVEAAGVQRV
jgi:hypothetical protein